VNIEAVNITASSYVVLLPILAKNVFLGDAKTLGYLWGAAGIGAFGATIFLSFQSDISRHPWIIMCSIYISAVGLVGSALSTQIAPCIFFLMLVGFGISTTNVSTNILLQSLAAEQLRGRIVSFYISIRFGFEAIGGLLAGWLVAASSTQPALIIEGVILIAAGALLFRHRRHLGI
jgi:sugar phosphate permease